MRKKHRVLFFKPILNWILGHCYTVLLIVLIGITFLLFPFFKNLIWGLLNKYKITLSSFQEDILSGLIVTVIPSLLTGFCFLLKGNSKNSKWIKRKFYNICTYLYKNVHIPKVLKNLISNIVNIFYFHNRELIQTQQYVVDDILNSLNTITISNKHIYWIKGTSYSGKTMTILNLLIDLISRTEYSHLFQKLDGNIIYFDLGKSNVSLNNLLRDYQIEKFSNCLVILDNLHKLSGKSCLNLLEKMVLHNHAFAIIILLRYPEEFLSENDRVNELKKIILENGTEYALSPLKPYNFENYHEDGFIKFCENFFALEQVIQNTEISIHLYMLYMKRNYDSFKVISEVQSFLRGNNITSTIAFELQTIIVSCLFTGSFNIRLMLNCLPHTSETKCKKLLNELTKVGFLTNYPNSYEDFYFHERIAKAYFKETINNLNYNDFYVELFEKLSRTLSSCNNNILDLLYAMMAQDTIKAKKIFSNIVVNVNFMNLYSEMMFLFELKVCEISRYYKEMGILCDRCGKLQEARRLFSLYMDAEKSADAFYRLVQIDHKTIDKYPEINSSALDSSNAYIKNLSNYWQIHINMHRGIFQFQRLFELACELQNCADTLVRDNPYDGLHLIRRVYFDLFRLYYLDGVFQPERLDVFIGSKSKIFRILKNNLEEFEAYYIKFAVGLMLGQDILFSLALEKKGLDLEKYKFLFESYVKLEHVETFDYKAIAKETIRIYLQAIEMFDKISDKTSIFVKYHMFNMKLLLIDDGNFSECERFYEDYMAFATKENILEYQAYAETFKLKMSLIKLCSPAIIESYGNDQYDELKNIIQQKMELAQKYDELANPGHGNQYAQLRINIYSILFSFFIKKISLQKFAKEINNIKIIAQQKGYHRELKIVKYIENCNYSLSPESIRIIFSFYPIVPQ